MIVDLRGKLEELLAHAGYLAISISELKSLLEAVEKTGDGRLVNPNLLTLLLTSVIHPLGIGEGRDFRLKLTVHMKDDLL